MVVGHVRRRVRKQWQHRIKILYKYLTVLQMSHNPRNFSQNLCLPGMSNMVLFNLFMHNKRKSITFSFQLSLTELAHKMADKVKLEIAMEEKFRERKKDLATQAAKCLFICRKSHSISVPSVCLAQITINFINTDSSICL